MYTGKTRSLCLCLKKQKCVWLTKVSIFYTGKTRSLCLCLMEQKSFSMAVGTGERWVTLTCYGWAHWASPRD